MMKGSSNDNGKVSDSGYTNTCSSKPRKSGDSSGTSNRDESSGFFCADPSPSGSSNDALKPSSNNKRKNEEHKKNKSKPLTDSGTETGNEVARVKSVEVMTVGENNVDSSSTKSDDRVGTITNPIDDINSNDQDGFTAIISTHNGHVIDVTETVKKHLGYERDDWSGRSFVDFVHPKDKSVFVDRLAENIALPGEDNDNVVNGRQTDLFCYLRKRDEKTWDTGDSMEVTNNAITDESKYRPFRLTTRIKYSRRRDNDVKMLMLLVIDAKPIPHVYKAPEETIVSTIFFTRHDPKCVLTNVDHNAVRYLGYLPKDMIGRSLFDFYHPEDLPYIKDVYETVVKMEGWPFRSKPYRFATQNGGYVLLETEWTSFVNPWKAKIEFVSGHHRILRGPANPDVFQRFHGCQRDIFNNTSGDVFKAIEIIKTEIRAFLHQRIGTTDCIEELDLTPSDLAKLARNLLQEVRTTELKSKNRATIDDKRFSEPKGAMIDGTLPHLNKSTDSESSSKLLPSYHRLNYEDKIERFFNSKPLTNAAYVSEESSMHSSGPSNDKNANSGNNSNDDNAHSGNQSNDDVAKSTMHRTARKDTTRNGSGSGGSGSGNDLSSDPNNLTSSGNRDEVDNARSADAMQTENLKLPTLTKKLLSNHNVVMEKLMQQQHKDQRSTIECNKLSDDTRTKKTTNKSTKKSEGQTRKRIRQRCGSSSRNGKRLKISKSEKNRKTSSVVQLATMANVSVNSDRATVNTWPAVALPAISRTLPYICEHSQSSGSQVSSKFGTTTAQPVSNELHQSPFVSYATMPLANMISSPPVVSTANPFFAMTNESVQRETPQSNFASLNDDNPWERKRPASQATSVKAERGDSVTMPEFSTKISSPRGPASPCVSIEGRCSSPVSNTKRETDTNSHCATSLEDSSDSSFYGNFLSPSTLYSCSPNRNLKASQKTFGESSNIDTDNCNNNENCPPGRNGVKMTNRLIYRYQIEPKSLSEVLKSDWEALQRFDQPQLVANQLVQLCSDMNLGGAHPTFLLLNDSTDRDSHRESPMVDVPHVTNEVRNRRGHH